MILANYTKEAQRTLLQTQDLAQKKSCLKIEPEHLVLCLIKTEEITAFIKKKQIDFKGLEKEILELADNLPHSNELMVPVFSSRFMQVLSSAQTKNLKEAKKITNQDLLLALIREKSRFGALGGCLSKHFLETKPKRVLPEVLAKYCENINHLVSTKKLEKVYDGQKELSRLVQILSRKNRNNPLLVGEVGVGKNSLITALVQTILAEKVPSYLMTKEVLSLNAAKLLSGCSLRGELESRLLQIVQEIKKEPGKYILYIRDLDSLLKSSGQGGTDILNFLKTQMHSEALQVIALTTPKVFQLYIEADSSLERSFQAIKVTSPSKEECLKILENEQVRLEIFHRVIIKKDALDAVFDLCSKHLSEKALPQIGLDILDEACAKHRVLMEARPPHMVDFETRLKTEQNPNKRKTLMEKLETIKTRHQDELAAIESLASLKKEALYTDNDTLQVSIEEEESNLLKALKKNPLIDPVVSRQDVAEVISLQTNIPAEKMAESERERLSHMEETLKDKIIGQDHAVESVCLAIQRNRLGIRYGKKPIGSFLFLGPTGVGKTELAKSLTQFLFNDDSMMVRFDMSEFMEKQSVARLIGAPPGYKGYEEGGELTEKIKRRPYSVVLFDELEKAHLDVLNILLQILDEARLTDSRGNQVDFSNTILIMTSNIGAEVFFDAKSNHDLVKKAVLEILKERLKPELLNRIDETICFNVLDFSAITSIGSLLLSRLTKTLHKEGYELSVSQGLWDKILKEGFNPHFGARPLKRSITKWLENPIAKKLLETKCLHGKIQASLNKQNDVKVQVVKTP